MESQLKLGTSTIRKCVDIMINVRINKNKLFNKYISIIIVKCLQ
jgi:hypothetical protein